MSLILRRLTEQDETAFLRVLKEHTQFCARWKWNATYDNKRSFKDFLQLLKTREEGRYLPQGIVPDIFLIGFVDGVIVGRLTVRKRLTSSLQTYGGHIGYSVLPEYRRQGYGTEMLRQALQIYCRDLELRQVMMTVEIDNVGSYKAMEKNGCYLDDVFRDEEHQRLTRRYLIDL